ncbi:hypothetical protein [Streptomyces malaysiense]|uniref:hypothetical protein n=1 Tax=Streptomyces malaysiense TaxID=1428626 RepID=UPI001160A38E|nr:hypothetical protein [Streptomyces malaysiense]
MAELNANATRALEVVALIRSGTLPDEDCAELLTELQRLIPHPAWLDLMFHNDPSLTDEEVVNAASSYRPFAL